MSVKSKPSFVFNLKPGCVWKAQCDYNGCSKHCRTLSTSCVWRVGVPQCLDLSPMLFVWTLSQISEAFCLLINKLAKFVHETTNCCLLWVACIKRMCGSKLRELHILQTTVYINESPVQHSNRSIACSTPLDVLSSCVQRKKCVLNIPALPCTPISPFS